MVVCAFIYFFHANTIDSTLIGVFMSLFLFVHLSIVVMHFCKIINPLQGSIDRTVTEMIKNDMVKDVKELEMFGSRVDERKISTFRHSNNESLWMRAFKCVNVENMKYLMNLGPSIDINQQDEQNGQSPIIYASIKNNTTAIKLLLNHPEINVNQCDNHGWNALFYAAKNNHLPNTQLLVEHGADINVIATDTGQTPIIYSAMINQIDIINWLVKQPHINVNHRDNDGCNALFYAVKNKNLQITELLTESGANVNAIVHESHQTPLIEATMQNRVDIVRFLVNQPQIDVNHCNNDGCSALLSGV